MYITQMYKYKKDNITYIRGQLPEDAILLEMMDILTAEDGYELENILTGERTGSLWLKEGDSQDNYREIPTEQEE